MSPNELTHWSYSSIKTLMGCMRSWYIQYVMKEKTPSGEAASFGSAFDQNVLKAFGATVDKKEEPVKLDEETAKQVQSAVEFYALQPQSQPWRGCRGQVKIEITPEEWSEYADIYGVESRIRVPFIGYIDMLRQDGVQVELTDLKTSSRAEFRPEWVLQQTLYALPTRASVCHTHLLTRLKTKFGFHARRFRPLKQTYAWAIATVGQWAEIGEQVRLAPAADTLAASPGFWCSYCPANARCEAARLQTLEEY